LAHEETILEIMNNLVIADKHIVGDIMAHKGLWTAGTSSVNNSYKALNNLVDAGKLVKGDGYFKIPTCKSEYKEHSVLLTKALALILKINLNCKIFREPTFQKIGLRPDAIVLITKDNKALCFILEVCNNETPEYLTQKINAWKIWPEAGEELSALFGLAIPRFDIVVSGEYVKGVFEFNAYIEEVKK